MPTEPEQPIIPFASRDAWEAWLEEHHTAKDGLWLRFAKKGSGLETVTYDQAVGTALCTTAERRPGAQVRRVLLPATFTPRRPRSKWSKINRQKVTELIERGAMKPAEFRAVLTENGALVPFHRAVFDKLGEDLV